MPTLFCCSLDCEISAGISTISFLACAVLDFLSDEAIENASLITSYLSDADNILASMTHQRFHRITDTYEPDSIRQQIVASVAVRGVLFGNSRPSRSRFIILIFFEY